MIKKISLLAVVAITISGCSLATHNTSKGVCRDISVCREGQCTTKADRMTQNNCEMVGGQFEPVDHRSGWFNF